jgi:hypothetical protein
VHSQTPAPGSKQWIINYCLAADKRIVRVVLYDRNDMPNLPSQDVLIDCYVKWRWFDFAGARRRLYKNVRHTVWHQKPVFYNPIIRVIELMD